MKYLLVLLYILEGVLIFKLLLEFNFLTGSLIYNSKILYFFIMHSMNNFYYLKCFERINRKTKCEFYINKKNQQLLNSKKVINSG